MPSLTSNLYENDSGAEQPFLYIYEFNHVVPAELSSAIKKRCKATSDFSQLQEGCNHVFTVV